jgi:hypothetical protein
MEDFSLHGFRFKSESLLLVSGQDEIECSEAEYEQLQRPPECDVGLLEHTCAHLNHICTNDSTDTQLSSVFM